MAWQYYIPQHLFDIEQRDLVLASSTVLRSDRACKAVAILHWVKSSTVSAPSIMPSLALTSLLFRLEGFGALQGVQGNTKFTIVA